MEPQLWERELVPLWEWSAPSERNQSFRKQRIYVRDETELATLLSNISLPTADEGRLWLRLESFPAFGISGGAEWQLRRKIIQALQPASRLRYLFLYSKIQVGTPRDDVHRWIHVME